MKITITNESGDWKEMLYTKDKITYSIKSQEIIDFFNTLSEAYVNDECTLTDMYEHLYNLINFGYLSTDNECDDDNYTDYDDNDDDCENVAESNEALFLIGTDTEYYVDYELASKEEYELAYESRLGNNPSTHWDDEGLVITNAETDEIIFSGKI